MKEKLKFNNLKAIFLSAVMGTGAFALPAFSHEGADVQEKYEDAECFNLADDDDDIKSYQRLLKKDIEEYDKQSEYAKIFSDYVRDKDIDICYAELGETTLGLWGALDNSILLDTSIKYSEGQRMNVFYHEALHAMQGHSGQLSVYKIWSIEPRHATSLFNEAAARVASFVVGYDMTKYGNDKIWNKVKSFNGATDYKNAYESQIIQGASKEEAIQYAGSKAWVAVFDNEWWIEACGELALDAFLEAIQKGDFQDYRLSYINDPYEDIKFSEVGRIHDDINLTRDIQNSIPLSMMFGENKDMRDISRYLHVEYLANLYGRSDTEYKRAFRDLKNDENPYIGVDVYKISADSDRDIIEHFNCFAGLAECKEEYGYDFDPLEQRLSFPEPGSRVFGKVHLPKRR